MGRPKSIKPLLFQSDSTLLNPVNQPPRKASFGPAQLYSNHQPQGVLRELFHPSKEQWRGSKDSPLDASRHRHNQTTPGPHRQEMRTYPQADLQEEAQRVFLI
jgi:hypothetical protein